MDIKSYFFEIYDLALFPILTRLYSDELNKFCSALTKASFSGLTNQPKFLLLIEIQGVFVVVIIGNPKNIASAIAIPNDSEYEGKIKAEASLKTLDFSSLKMASFNSTNLFNRDFSVGLPEEFLRKCINSTIISDEFFLGLIQPKRSVLDNSDYPYFLYKHNNFFDVTLKELDFRILKTDFAKLRFDTINENFSRLRFFDKLKYGNNLLL